MRIRLFRDVGATRATTRSCRQHAVELGADLPASSDPKHGYAAVVRPAR